MAYKDDIVIATETVEVFHMVRLREVFECLREAGFKMRVAKCDSMKSEIKKLGREVWASPTITASSFLGMPNWLLPCMPSQASMPPSSGNPNNNWTSMR